MGYIAEFKKQISKRDLAKFLELWEEYCSADKAEAEEFQTLLQSIQKSDLAASIGSHIEKAIPLWQTIDDFDSSYRTLKLIMNIQTTNSPVLAEAAFQMLKTKHGEDPHFSDRIRLIGLRARDNFQGAIANYDLLAHMGEGQFVFHTGGWGCGEIMDYSAVREQIGVEFEHMAGLKFFTFANAFKTLEPLGENHFLVKRFADPDAFEEEARKDPVAAVKLLLTDLGPKTAAEIKEEMCELVIPEKDWTKWWQGARARLKKDPLVNTPKNIRDPFTLRESEITHQEILQSEIHDKQEEADILVSCYNLIRDIPNVKKNQEIFDSVKSKLLELLKAGTLEKAQQFQVYIMLDEFFSEKPEEVSLAEFVKSMEDIEKVVQNIGIIALKKRALGLIRENREDWKEIFLELLFQPQLSPTRDYLFLELLDEKMLHEKLEELQQNPSENPELVFWFFQKLYSAKKSGKFPYSDKEGECLWFDSLLVVLHTIEHDPEQRDLLKKIVQFISAQNYLVVRYMFEGSTLEWTKEFLLLLSKCMVFEESEQKIFRSLAQVVHSSIEDKEKPRERHDADLHVFWASESAYAKARERAQHIATVEMVENADEVKKARELGDLRENAEYKAACERRRNLQHDLRVLSDQINRARVLTRDDISSDSVGIGTIVELKDSAGEKVTYTILGLWDADVDKGILSIQSKLAQSMLGRKVGDVFTFRDEEYTVCSLGSFLDK